MSDEKERPATPPRPQPKETPEEIPFQKRYDRIIDDDVHEAEWEPPRDEDVPLDKEESD